MASSQFELSGKVAIVTGASQGIGRALAIALADAGAAVAVTDLGEKLDQSGAVCAEIRINGGTAREYALDVTDVAAIRLAVDRAVADFGRIDILVNNAGIGGRDVSLEVTERRWDAVLGANLKGAFFCAQAAAGHMVTQGSGRIINIASQLAISAGPRHAAYIASKGGLVSLTKSLALEWVSSGVTVNAVGPGPVDTPLSVSSGRDPSRPIPRSPLGRRLQPEEVASAVVFLASAAAQAITGQLLLVDGGWTAG